MKRRGVRKNHKGGGSRKKKIRPSKKTEGEKKSGRKIPTIKSEGRGTQGKRQGDTKRGVKGKRFGKDTKRTSGTNCPCLRSANDMKKVGWKRGDPGWGRTREVKQGRGGS